MTVMFDGAGLKAEALAAKQFNGVLTNNKEHQYADIDLFVKGKDNKERSISVKDQLWSSSKYGAIQVELTLCNTRNNKTIDGCFYSSKADYYFWRVSVDGKDSWLVIECCAMQQYVKENMASLKQWSTRPNTEERNRSYGRTYDRAMGVVLPINTIKHLGKVIEVVQ